MDLRLLGSRRICSFLLICILKRYIIFQSKIGWISTMTKSTDRRKSWNGRFLYNKWRQRILSFCSTKYFEKKKCKLGAFFVGSSVYSEESCFTIALPVRSSVCSEWSCFATAIPQQKIIASMNLEFIFLDKEYHYFRYIKSSIFSLLSHQHLFELYSEIYFEKKRQFKFVWCKDFVFFPNTSTFPMSKF